MTAEVSTAVSNREFLRALVVAVLSLTISAALLIGLYLLAFPQLYPEYLPDDPAARPFSLTGRDLTPVMAGTAQREGDSALVTALAPGTPDDQAIIRRTVNLNAGNFTFLRYHLEGRHPGLRVMLFWKTAVSGDEPFYAEIDNAGNGTQYHNLRRSDEWQGTITEIAIGVFGDLRGKTLRVRDLRLEPYSAGRLLGTIWDEWTAFAPWDQKSINRYVGVSKGALLYPAPSAALWLALGACLIWAWRRNGLRLHDTPTFPLVSGLALATGITWLGLHGLWLHKLWQQNQETRYLFHGKSLHGRQLADWDGEYYAFANEIERILPENVNKLALIFSSRDLAEPFPQRLRYHLLPDVKLDLMYRVTPGRLKRVVREHSYLIILRDFSGAPANPMALLEEFSYQQTGNEAILVDSPVGTLIQLRKQDIETHGGDA